MKRSWIGYSIKEVDALRDSLTRKNAELEVALSHQEQENEALLRRLEQDVNHVHIREHARQQAMLQAQQMFEDSRLRNEALVQRTTTNIQAKREAFNKKKEKMQALIQSTQQTQRMLQDQLARKILALSAYNHTQHSETIESQAIDVESQHSQFNSLLEETMDTISEWPMPPLIANDDAVPVYSIQDLA